MKSLTNDQTNDPPAIHGIRSQNKQVQKLYCDRCGNWHTKQQVCPALGAECRKCGRRNHFAKVCRTRATQSQPLFHYSIQKEAPDNDQGRSQDFLKGGSRPALSYQKQGSGGAAPSRSETFNILMNQNSANCYILRKSTLIVMHISAPR